MDEKIKTIIVKTNEKEILNSIYKLRFQGFITEEHIAPLSEFPDKLLFDEYDKYGINICSICDKEILGSVLIVLRKNVPKFSFEEIYSLKDIPENSSELRRLVINSKVVKNNFLFRAVILKELMNKIKEVMLNNEINYAYMICRRKYLNMYKKIGFREVEEFKKDENIDGKYLMYIDFSESKPTEILNISKLENKNDL